MMDLVGGLQSTLLLLAIGVRVENQLLYYNICSIDNTKKNSFTKAQISKLVVALYYNIIIIMMMMMAMIMIIFMSTI